MDLSTLFKFKDKVTDDVEKLWFFKNEQARRQDQDDKLFPTIQKSLSEL